MERRMLDVTKSFQQIAVIPPVKLLGVLNYFRGKFHAQPSAIQEWIERWSQKLSSWEVCQLVKCRFNLLDKNDGYVPISIIQSHGWLPGRDAAILAQTHLSPNVKVATYSAEQKEYWCRFATNKELRDLLDSRVIVRNDEKYFRKLCVFCWNVARQSFFARYSQVIGEHQAFCRRIFRKNSRSNGWMLQMNAQTTTSLAADWGG